jgi:hypothetical protein
MPRDYLTPLTNNDIIIQSTFTPSRQDLIILLQILLQIHAIYVILSVTDHISQLHKISDTSNLCILIFSGMESKWSNQFPKYNNSTTWIYSSLTFMANISFLFSHIMKHYQMIYALLFNTCYAHHQTCQESHVCQCTICFNLEAKTKHGSIAKYAFREKPLRLYNYF